MTKGPIGIFDSGYGGLTILKEITAVLPQYDYLYLGDNARSPYGPRSFETVYQYTLQAVKWFFEQDCSLVILACNTASAKALRTIQQNDLPHIAPDRRVLGVIRPTSEVIGQFSTSKHIGILATAGTVASNSYGIEMEKFFPGIQVYQQACPMWVPLIENNEFENAGASFFIQKHTQQLLQQSAAIDTVLLACTHYPLLAEQIKQWLPQSTRLISQGPIVANSLKDYLARHSELEERCTQNGKRQFFTTDSAVDFNNHASIFYGEAVQSVQVHLK